MKIKNRLQVILDQSGLENHQPSDQLLLGPLGGMTRKRFYQILRNDSKQELDAQELQLLEAWLIKAFRFSREEVQLLEQVEPVGV